MEHPHQIFKLSMGTPRLQGPKGSDWRTSWLQQGYSSMSWTAHGQRLWGWDASKLCPWNHQAKWGKLVNYWIFMDFWANQSIIQWLRGNCMELLGAVVISVMFKFPLIGSQGATKWVSCSRDRIWMGLSSSYAWCWNGYTLPWRMEVELAVDGSLRVTHGI